MKHAMRHVSVDEGTGCWNYTSNNVRGYPTIARRVPGNSRKVVATSAHRYFYTHLVGPIPPRMVVMHSCDNRFCCNPEHLSLGTQGENIRDMWAKGRWPKKEGVFFPPVSPEMRAAAMVLVRGGVNQSALARALGVGASTITRWKVLERAKQTL